MIQRDYIQRLTQDIARLLAKLIGLDAEESLEYLDIAYTEYLRLDKKEIDNISSDNIISFLTNEKGMSIPQLELVGEIMAKEGSFLHEIGNKQAAVEKIQSALSIFEYIEQEQQLFSLERQLSVQALKRLLVAPKPNKPDH